MAQLKDHRQIGKEMDLFSFSEYAPGAVFWHPKGWIVYQEIVKLIRSMLAKDQYQEIKTPVMVKNSLFKKSGHWKHFGEHNMFNLPIYEDEEIATGKVLVHRISESLSAPEVNYSLKPMNCPESTLIFNAQQRSYKDLPLKLSEFGILHRRELSGVLGGLFRVREFTIDDAHIYCRNDQIEAIVMELLSLITSFYKLFNFKLNFFVSTKPDKALAIPELPNLWSDAERGLTDALKKAGIKFGIKEKDGAFYGPKIDFHMTDSQERDWQLATIQLDFQMPRSLDVMYIDEHGQREYAVMIHRAITGSIERFIGILIEQYQGNFPSWFTPVQAIILPVSDKFNTPADLVLEELHKAGIRAEVNRDNKTLGAKIREATLQKMPYMCIIGEKEIQNLELGIKNSESARVSVRTRDGRDLGMMSISNFISHLREDIETKR